VSDASIKRTRAKTIIAKVEEGLIAIFDENLPKWVDIAAVPENPSDFDFANRDGALLVHYAGSRYAEPQGQSINQNRVMTWQLVLKTRSFNGEYGAYAVLEDIRQAAQGFSLEGGGPIRIIRDDLVSEADGVWEWRIVIALPIAAVARHTRRSQLSPVLGTQSAT